MSIGDTIGSILSGIERVIEGPIGQAGIEILQQTRSAPPTTGQQVRVPGRSQQPQSPTPGNGASRIALAPGPFQMLPPVGTVPSGTIRPASMGRELLEQFGGGGMIGNLLGSSVPRAPGGINMAIDAAGLFHQTPTGRILPNRITLVKDPASNAMGFFVNAGNPTRFSKINFKSRRRPR